MLAAIPIVALIYTVLMPFLGMTTIALVVGVKMLNGLSGIAGKNISFGWRHKNVYFSGEERFL